MHGRLAFPVIAFFAPEFVLPARIAAAGVLQRLQKTLRLVHGNPPFREHLEDSSLFFSHHAFLIDGEEQPVPA